MGSFVSLKYNYFRDKQLEALLIIGILVRIVVFIFQAPFNNDFHFAVVRYLFDSHTLPISGFSSQAYQPPLYYMLASLFLYLGNEKTIQLFSLILSIGTLAIIYSLIRNLSFICTFRIKTICLAFACFLPQFVMFGNYISNDTLSYLIGALIFLQVFKYINKPTMRNQNVLAIYLGLGLLTKSTIAPFIPALILVIIVVNLRYIKDKKKILFKLLIFALLVTLIGSYKYIENTIHYRQPFISNLSFNPDWADRQRPTYGGLESIYDINLLKLVRHPTVSKYTQHSYPLMLYGTFWYQYIPESNFKGNRTKFKYLGSLIYVLAIIPTLIFVIGFLRILPKFSYLFTCKNLNNECFIKNTYEIFSLFSLVAGLLLITIAGIKYDVWSCFQSRLLFPYFFSIIILFNSGLNYVSKISRNVQVAIYFILICLFLLFLLYFSTEIVRQIVYKYFGSISLLLR